MKLKNKLFIMLSILILIIFLISTISYGTLVDTFKASIKTDGSDDLKTVGGKIVGIIQIVGTIVSVGTLMVIGIKYIMGSAEEKASYKKTLFPYLIGAVLIFGASNLTQIIYSWATTI